MSTPTYIEQSELYNLEQNIDVRNPLFNICGSEHHAL